MNILVLCHEYPPLGGGGGVGAKQYAEAWAAKGHKVTVLTSWVKGLRFRENVDGVEVIRLFTVGVKNRATVPFVSMFCFFIFSFLYVLLRVRKFRECEVINTHFSMPNGPLGWLISKLLGIPHVLTIIGGDIYDPTKKSSPHRNFITRAINGWVINSADQVVAISSDTRRRAQVYYKVNTKIKVINYGFIPFESKQNSSVNLSRENGDYYLIAVGRLVSRKGFDYLIRSLTLLPAHIKLLLIGDGPMEAELKNLALETKVSDRVTFAGYKPRADIYEYLRSADCFVLSSLHEGLGIVVQEAMYAGLPVVATNNGGQTDLIRNPRNGILVDPANVKLLAAAIEQFYQDRNLGELVGRNNREDIANYFISTNSEEYIHLFKELAEIEAKKVALKWGSRTVTERVP